MSDVEEPDAPINPSPAVNDEPAPSYAKVAHLDSISEKDLENSASVNV